MTRPPRRVAFALSQLGTFGAQRFSQLVGELGLTAPEAGALRLLGHEPGISQRALATRLAAAPSRVVVLVDALEQKGLVTRRRSETDRRNHELHVTDAGTAMLRQLRTVAEKHEAELAGALTQKEQAQLADLLAKLGEAHGLDPVVHPGYRR